MPRYIGPTKKPPLHKVPKLPKASKRDNLEFVTITTWTSRDGACGIESAYIDQIKADAAIKTLTEIAPDKEWRTITVRVVR